MPLKPRWAQTHFPVENDAPRHGTYAYMYIYIYTHQTRRFAVARALMNRRGARCINLDHRRDHRSIICALSANGQRQHGSDSFLGRCWCVLLLLRFCILKCRFIKLLSCVCPRVVCPSRASSPSLILNISDVTHCAALQRELVFFLSRFLRSGIPNAIVNLTLFFCSATLRGGGFRCDLRRTLLSLHDYTLYCSKPLCNKILQIITRTLKFI